VWLTAIRRRSSGSGGVAEIAERVGSVAWRRVQRLAELRSRLAPSRRRNSRALASHVAGRRRRRAGATAAPWRSLRVGVWLLTEASSFFLSVSSSSLILLADARRPRTAGHQRSVISTGLLGQIQILIGHQRSVLQFILDPSI